MLSRLSFLPLLAVFTATSALANTETVTFTGTATTFCTITKNSDGTLSQAADNLSLGTLVSGGSSASFTVASNASSTLDLGSSLTVNSEPAGFNAVRTQSISVVDDQSSSLYSGDGSAGASATVTGNATGTIDLTITESSGGFVAPGSYSYTKTITCTAP
jgi:hypothetical protein